MSTLDTKLGLEEIQLLVFKAMVANINSKLAIFGADGDAIDAQIVSLAGVYRPAADLEPFLPENIHYGHRPSMIESPIEEYPSMAISVHSSRSAAVLQGNDFGDGVMLVCRIEFIVKAGPYENEDRTGEGESILGRRVIRTTEAIHEVVKECAPDWRVSNPDKAPNVDIGDIFVRTSDAKTMTGPVYFWQGAAIDYEFTKQSFNYNEG